MQQAKRIVIIAGEESGDLHASELVKQLKAKYPTVQFTGIGGRHMESAGVHLISDLARYGVTGISEVIRHLRVIRKAFQAIKTHLIDHKPDLLILVDYPGFNLRLAKFAKKTLGIPILYYISPQVWAWKSSRVYVIRDYVDHMAVILPFEKNIYIQAGVPASFVGHPLVSKIASYQNTADSRKALNLPEHKRLIAVLPGSRSHEIERHMPVLKAAMLRITQKHPDLHFVIPVAGTIDPEKINAYLKDSTLPYSLIHGKAIEVVASSDCAIVASGTASLECALLEKPMCIIYKASLLSYLAAMKFLKVKYLGLCNLLQNKMIVPELLQYDCNPKELTRMLASLLTDQEMLHHMLDKLQTLRTSLSFQQADCSLMELVETLMEKNGCSLEA